MSVESFVNRTKEVMEAAGRKACDLTDLAKLKLKLADNEKAIETALAALGRVVYDLSKGGEEQADVQAELIAQVDELLAENEKLQTAIDNNRSRKTCRACGKVNPETATYCNACGKALD